MTALKQSLARQIEATGPISVADYMAACLFDPRHGYYTTREPFGRDGDFITAPEVSQMFGELVGVWVRTAWDALGRPLPLTVAEIGPGRGTLMKDMLRVLAKLAPALVDHGSVALIETSPRLTAVQKATLAGSPGRHSWHASVDSLPASPLILVGNELFDAIPIRQYVRIGGAWRERVVTAGPDGELVFAAGAGTADPSLLPPDASQAIEGSVVELSPARTALMESIAARISAEHGAALFVDYGYESPAVGDTLQAVRQHRYEHVLASPGEADLTAHVDFAALQGAARRQGLESRLSTQGDFLLRLGLLERAGRLGAAADEAGRERIAADVERLAGPEGMGQLFKAMEVFSPDVAKRINF